VARKRRKKSEEKEIKSLESQRELFGIILLALALFFLFSLLNKAGIVGYYFNQILFFLGGWAAWLLPFLLLPLIYMLLRKKEVSLNILLGELFIFLSAASLLSLLGMEKAVINWQGLGGTVGGVLAFVFFKLFSFWFSFFLLVLWFLAGLILSFNFSLSSLVSKFKPVTKTEREKKKTEEPVVASSPFQKRGLTLFPFAKKQTETEGDKEGKYSIAVVDKDWNFPPIDLLDVEEKKPDGGSVEKRAEIIKKTLADYDIEVEMGEISVGPTVTQFTLKPKTGVKLSQIVSRADEIAYALAAHPIRIEAPIPGKSAVGVEVPNQEQAIVRLRRLLQSKEFAQQKSPLAFPLGRNVAGKPFITELTRMPHLLVAGATGTGKSVCLNSILTTFLFRNSPKTFRLILVDPKRVEFTLYNDIPHLLTPVISEVDKTISAFRWATEEMDRRYVLLQEKGKRNILEFNRSAKPDERLPYIVIIIDELADLMVQARREVEASIVRLTQMARATGIHLILATQRPSTDVITGLIKANITHRIAFQVASQIDSRTILDQGGAEKLLGRGDMLYLSADSPKPKRLQGPMVTEEEVRRITNYLKEKGSPHYQEEITSAKPQSVGLGSDGDELLEQAIEVVLQERRASASLLQRRLRIGYARAARLIDLLEEKGVVSPQEGSRSRQVLIDEQTFQDMKEKGLF